MIFQRFGEFNAGMISFMLSFRFAHWRTSLLRTLFSAIIMPLYVAAGTRFRHVSSEVLLGRHTALPHIWVFSGLW